MTSHDAPMIPFLVFEVLLDMMTLFEFDEPGLYKCDNLTSYGLVDDRKAIWAIQDDLVSGCSAKTRHLKNSP